MNIQTRMVEVVDCNDVARLSNQLGYTISLEDTARHIQSIADSTNDLALVALMDSHIVGWIHVFYTVRIESAPYCEIGGLVIDEANRNKGIGKTLVESVKEWCKAKGVTTLRVRCNVKRADSHQFYIHTGFKEIKEQKVFGVLL